MTTPMFEQFHALKAEVPDAILFFRMGDFYETFFEDARVAAEVLELTLTARNKGDPDPVPMAGVPHHAANGYVQRLVDAGHRVAIAEQVEDPAQAKGLVRREVVRVVTPGVVLDPTALDARSANWLAAVHRAREGWGLGVLDASTGDLRQCTVGSRPELLAELMRLEPREVLIGPSVTGEDREALVAELSRHGVRESALEGAWRASDARARIEEALGVQDLSGFGVSGTPPGLVAAGAALRYAQEVMRAPITHVHRLRTWSPGRQLVIDPATWRNLEIVRTVLGGQRKGSLLGLIDRTRTAMGGRLLREWLAAPLIDRSGIEARQDLIEQLVLSPQVRSSVQEGLRSVSDLERLGGRIAQRTANPREVRALSDSLRTVPKLRQALQAVGGRLAGLLPQDGLEDVADEVETWLVDDPPTTSTEGGLIRRGADPELDALVSLALEGQGVISQMEIDEREKTGISSLKIKQNRVFGYFIEVTRANLHRVPDHYLRKQTLSGSERYITPELKELEDKVLGADERRKALELQHFLALRERVGERLPRLTALARAVAAIDVVSALADVAERRRWVRPKVVDEPVLEISGGRHPVVEASVDEGQYVPNDLWLDPVNRRMVVLTGPNMAGKSTVLRMAALVVLLAHMGCPVPADQATVGITDRIFTRVGAADDLVGGRSTFMVEMAETSSILHHATSRSLVVLDEIGRGTSTYDGLSIAWAVAEDLVDRVSCRALFATHYHELCELAETRPAVVNQSIAVRDTGETILFLRSLVEGGASRSYGIACARLAGLPRPVVDRATSLLSWFEKHAPRNDQQQLSLFGGSVSPSAAPVAPAAVTVDPLAARVREMLETMDPDAMSPREALDALYRLKRGLDET